MSIYSQKHNQKTIENPNTSLHKIFSLISPQSNTILDVGCSSGYLGQYIKQISNNKIKVDGIELDKNDYKIAQQYLDTVINIDIQNINNLKKITQKYDTIIFADILEHTINPHQILKQLSNNLQPTGQVIISLPNIIHQSIVLEVLSGQWNYEESGLLDKTHVHFFDFNEIVRLIENNSLYINKIDFSIFDLPKQKISKILQKQNLKKNIEIIKLLKKPQHQIFQYIISASIKKPNKYKTFLNNQQILKPASDWINEWETTLKKFKNTQKIEEELAQIKNSKLFKLWNFYTKVKNLIKTILPSHD